MGENEAGGSYATAYFELAFVIDILIHGYKRVSPIIHDKSHNYFSYDYFLKAKETQKKLVGGKGPMRKEYLHSKSEETFFSYLIHCTRRL